MKNDFMGTTKEVPNPSSIKACECKICLSTSLNVNMTPSDILPYTEINFSVILLMEKQ